jgi:hypothetical protein
MITDTIITPTEAHAAAIADHARALANHQAADAELASATLAKQNLLRQAADGAAVSTADIRGAEDAIREAEASAALASAIAKGKRRVMDRAEVTVLTARAAELTEAWRQAVQRKIDAAQAADDALAVAKSKTEEVDAAHLDLSVAYAAAQEHDRHVEQRAVDNAELAKIEKPYRPRAGRQMQLHEHTSVEAGFIARSWGGRTPRDIQLGNQARSLYAPQLPATAPTKAA